MKHYGLTFLWQIPATWSYSVISADPEIAEYILVKNFKNYIKGPILTELLQDLLGRGIFVSNGTVWRNQRKIASHLFKVTQISRNCFSPFHST